MHGLKVISFGLMLLMFVQLLPVQQIGKALSQSRWTEELPHNNETLPEDGHFIKPFLPVAAFAQSFDAESSIALMYIHFSEQIPVNHSADILSPPPDVC